jgi:Ca2+-binding RTX toxin-like protein
MTFRRLASAVPVAAVLAAFAGGVAGAQTHVGWPHIDGVLKINKSDVNGTIRGTHRSDELLGGNGNDTIFGRGRADVIWGDYKPSGQPTTQVDHLYGGDGADFIYASHGRNVIAAGAGNDTVHTHFGRGSIDCGSGTDTLFISHRARPGYTIRHCEHISYHSAGHS